MTDIKEYTQELQTLFVEFLAHDNDLFVRVNGILDPAYFDRTLRKTVAFIQDYANEYAALPTDQQILATSGIELKGLGDNPIDERHREWFIDEFETFCKHKALEGAILKSADLLENGEFGAVEKIIKDAVQIGLAKHMGTNYWESPAERIQRIRDARGATSTGWKEIDKKLYGGFNRGELNIFAAPSGGGKSLFLQNLALNWSLAGHNVLYISLELSEELCSMRLDGMLTGMNTTEVFKNVDDVDLKVRIQGKSAGSFQVVQLPNGITVNQLNSYIKEYEVKYNIKVDALCVDYLDLMSPAQTKVSASDLFIKDKFVSEELRNFAVEHQFLFATASQLNRAAVEEVEFDHSHIAGGISKIQTADNVIGIFTSTAMRERGRYQIQFMKTRSSAGVGSKVDLAFDTAGLRITDLPEDAEEVTQVSSIYDKIKKKSTLKQSANNLAENAVADRAIDNTDKLRNILKKQD
jgi:KaiC/GvpD/RAD55 family RecA-like ATPase